MKLVQFEAAWVNPEAVAAVLPDNGDNVHGIELRPPNPNRCIILLTSGRTIAVEQVADDVRQSLLAAG